jgi:hypothetical protein
VDFTSFELENQMKLRLRNREALYLKKFWGKYHPDTSIKVRTT